MFATSGATEALALLLLVGTEIYTVLKMWVVVVRVPLVTAAGEDPTSSGMVPEEPDSDPALPLPVEPDELEPDPLPSPLPLPPADPEPAIPLSEGDDETVEVDPAAVTGHTVVVIATISVVTEPIRAGQPVIFAAQEVTV